MDQIDRNFRLIILHLVVQLIKTSRLEAIRRKPAFERHAREKKQKRSVSVRFGERSVEKPGVSVPERREKK